MGPLSGNAFRMKSATLHSHCQNRENCIGPGCIRNTGKTEQRNRKRNYAVKARSRPRRESE